MSDIVHRVGIRATKREVFKALATSEGLKGWWTKRIEGESKVGFVLGFRFPDGGPDMRVKVLKPSRRVQWECVAGIEEWIGTKVHFEITRKKGNNLTFVFFSHRGFKRETSTFAHCSLKWGVFLLSLKQYLETGRGRPFPQDVKIEDYM